MATRDRDLVSIPGLAAAAIWLLLAVAAVVLFLVSVTGGDEAVVLTVDDEGIGIPEGQHARMFRRLYRATNVRDRAVPGTGLGLTRSRIVAERHHGTITLRPREPAGTSAVVRLPAAATTSPEAPARAG